MKRFLPLVIACLIGAVVVFVPAAGARSSASDSSVSAADQQYLQTSIQGDEFEIFGGKVAVKKTHNPAVMRLAKRLVADHAMSLKDAVKLAHKLRINVPPAPTPSEVWELKVVAAAKGTAFNRLYSTLEVYDHLQDIEETTSEVAEGTNQEIRADARSELPMLKMHLKMARMAAAAVK
jgi:putative membrane protein